MLKGTVKWIDESGRGYIVADGGPTLFFDTSVVDASAAQIAELASGTRVEFKSRTVLSNDCAVDVRLA